MNIHLTTSGAQLLHKLRPQMRRGEVEQRGRRVVAEAACLVEALHAELLALPLGY
jgi:hypothetical protein